MRKYLKFEILASILLIIVILLVVFGVFSTKPNIKPNIKQIVIVNDTNSNTIYSNEVYNGYTVNNYEDLVNYFEIMDSLEMVYNKPFKMVTEYHGITLIDYGTFKELDSIKCIRYHEMELKIKEQEIVEKQLEDLNKPCK